MPLTLVMLRQWNSYGYELVERSVELKFETVNSGTVYRTLRKMENEGLCQTTWDTSNNGGRARRIYSVTPAGEAHLDSWADYMAAIEDDPEILALEDTSFTVHINTTADAFARTLEDELPEDVDDEVRAFADGILDRGFRGIGDADV